MNYYNEIKDILLSNEINRKVKNYSMNKIELEAYYNVGKLIIEAQGGEERAKYGNQLIKQYSVKLTRELGKGYSERNLKYMRKFYLFYQNKIWQPVVAKLNWTQICIIMTLNNVDRINYYSNICVQKNISKRQLQKIIKEQEYERLPKETKEKLKNNEELSIIETIKNPILIKNNNVKIDNIKEKVLQKLILEDLNNFLSQLGRGYAYIGNEYKIKIGDSYNYIDILLYNTKYHCYVVVELKVIELKKEHIGQIEVYMNYIDYNVKDVIDNKTIGLIVVKENNQYIIKYSSDDRIKAIEYSLGGIK